MCGDWYVNPAAGEQCDQGGVATSTCTASCTMPLCGNGIVEGTEQCDDWGATTYFCEHDCTTPVCGDGYVNEAAGESCDRDGKTATAADNPPTCMSRQFDDGRRF